MKIAIYILSLMILSLQAFSQMQNDTLKRETESILISKETEIKEQYKFGLFGGYSFNFHNADFRFLPGVPNCCPHFESGSGNGFLIGALADYLIDERFFLELRAGYNYFDGTLTETEATTVLIADLLTEGEFEHSVTGKFSNIFLEPMLGINVIENLKFLIGPKLGITSLHDFSQYEKIIKPADIGVFPDTKTRFRNDTSGSISDASSIQLSFSLGLSYELPLNRTKTFSILPEIFFDFGLNNLVKNTDWKSNALHSGISIKYYPQKSTEEEIEIYKETIEETQVDTTVIASFDVETENFKEGQIIFNKKEIIYGDNTETTKITYNRTDTLFIPEKPQKVEIEILAVDEGKPRRKATDIFIQQHYVTQAFPILPIVFFDKNTSKLPKRFSYIEDKDSFIIDDLQINPINYNYNVLNIIGKRLADNPNANITLNGYSDPTSEVGDCYLAISRAKEIKRYLEAIWGIAPFRMVINENRTECSPENPTQTQTEDGFAENRRVEIESNFNEILAPISQKKFIEARVVTPASLEFSAKSKEEIHQNWTFSIYQNEDKPILHREGKGNLQTINFEINEKQANSMLVGTPLICKFTIGKGKNSDEYRDTLIITKDTSKIEIDRLSLAIYQVAGDSLREVDKIAIRHFIEKLKENDSIYVYGYSDDLGSEQINRTLSINRSKIACSFIQNILEENKINAVIAKCEGVWFLRTPPGIVSYKLPEERFLSRTVQIEIHRRR